MRLAYSTRWFDPTSPEYQKQPGIEAEIYISVDPAAHQERIEALAKRSGLTHFLRKEVRSHVAA